MFKHLISPFVAAVLLISCFMSSCTKENTPRLPALGLADSSETKPWLDSTNFGVFKGVLTGETGRIKIYFRNGDTIMKAHLTIDSLEDDLVCTEIFQIGQPVVAAQFTGTRSSFNFTVDETGLQASLDNILVDGRINVYGVIAHESTSNLVYCYESKFTGGQRGQFNFIRYMGNLAQGLARTENDDTFFGKGLVTGDAFKLTLHGPLGAVRTFQGGIESTGDYFSGSWLESTPISGVFNGVRTQ